MAALLSIIAASMTGIKTRGLKYLNLFHGIVKSQNTLSRCSVMTMPKQQLQIGPASPLRSKVGWLG
jgi:hypothetical protein